MSHIKRETTLLGHLHWFVRLRWIAGGVVIIGALLDWQWLGWHSRAPVIAAMGAVILAYNAVLWQLMTYATNKRRMMALVWLELLLDMTCLTMLTVWTGGARSPVAGFFVFHMVLSSLLLSQRKAFASAIAALVIISAGLALAGQWPATLTDRLAMLGLGTTLLLTVYVANRITRGLRRQRRRLIRQNHRMRAISDQLARTQQAMIQHEKMVALGQMAAGVAHEVANPLASMDSLLQLMLRKPDRVKHETLTTLREQIDRINQIIRQMKSFAHPVEMQLKTEPLNKVVDDAIAMVQMDPRWRRVELIRQLGPEAGSLTLAPQALHQVLVNLIVNALDAMQLTERPKLIIATFQKDEWCMIDITDNGHGISPEHLDRLFEPFFTTKPVGHGTGLGLSISYSLIQRLGGSISVRSQLNVATTFTVRLPALPDSRGREPAPAPFAASEKPRG
jgi:C4-dicarboxylate-specific signal transduction histidine kinase